MLDKTVIFWYSWPFIIINQFATIMINLKKTLIFTILLAVAVSPFIPSVKATDGQWGTATATDSWDYNLYRVERLSFGKTVQGPFEFNDGVFLTEQAKSCKYPSTCELVDTTFMKNGSALKVANVAKRVTSPFWHTGQDGRFVYLIPSNDDKTWGTVLEYVPETGIIQTLQAIEHKADDLNFLTSSVDGTRVYASILHIDANTKAIETKLVAADYASGYKMDDFTWTLPAPWQEIVDVKDRIVLAKFRFDGGFSQLILIDELKRTVTEIPNTWTEPNGELAAAHFLSDGTVQYFKNFRLYTYKPGVDVKPMESGGAYLNWFVPSEDAVQIAGDRMAYIDPENTLYVTNPSGASSFGKALGGKFTLEADAIHYESTDGPISYTFSTRVWKRRSYRVADSYKDILVGIDKVGNIWYENLTSGKTLKVGYGTDPVLTDREHALWKGVDGKIYQATFSTLLDLGNPKIQAVKASGTNTVYLMNGTQMWRITDEPTYFTWFDSWADTVSVSPQTLNAYKNARANMGNAPFAPGARVKAIGNPRVYVSGSDGSLHWIVSETVADSIYGSSWNKDIVEVRPERLWNYSTGESVESSKDIQII
jgi:hypothetical protein